ncbi:hypothetical protein Tco_0457993 [Tanacetum coccineum]
MKVGVEWSKAVKRKCNYKNEGRYTIYKGNRRNIKRHVASETDVAESQPCIETTYTRGIITYTKDEANARCLLDRLAGDQDSIGGLLLSFPTDLYFNRLQKQT